MATTPPVRATLMPSRGFTVLIPFQKRGNTNMAAEAIIILYQTNGPSSRLMSLPKMAVKPKMNTVKCSFTKAACFASTWRN